MNLQDYKAVWFDAFWTLITEANKLDRLQFVLTKKYWWDMKKSNLLTTIYSQNIEDYLKETFKSSWVDFSDLSEEEKEKLMAAYQKDLDSYQLRESSEQLLEKVKHSVDQIFLLSNLSSLYIPVVEKLWLWNYFNFILFSCNEWLKKDINNPEICELACKKLVWIDKKKVIYTWDKEWNDEIAPKNAWFDAINIEKFREIILNT